MVQIFLARLVLEVFGGGGAIWGFSEVITFRNPSTQEVWRRNAQIVGAIFFIRFLLQMLDFVQHKNRDTFSPIRLIQVFLAKIVLEVFGAAGAIWGFSEALTLRVAKTNEFYRWFAVVVGVIFFIRYLLQISDFVRITMKKKNDESYEEKYVPCWTRFYQIFAAKLVLEVFGAAGAIWGFSEVLTLRRASTQEEWRFRALTVGALFFIRYGLQMKDYIIKIRFGKEALLLPLTNEQWIRLIQVYSAKLVLEVFGGGGAVWGFSEVVTFRTKETQEFWRCIAAATGFIFFCRFNCQIMDFLCDIVEQQQEQYGNLMGDNNMDGLALVLAGEVVENGQTTKNNETTPLMINGATYS